MTLVLAIPDGVRTLATGDAEAPVTGVIPGDDVALHHLALLETSPDARREEARMRAVDLSAQPIDDVHVAVGAPGADGGSWVALIDRDRMAGHIAHFRAAGVEPAHIVPAPLLLDEVAPDGMLARLDDRILVRTPVLAGLVEPELAPLVAGAAWKGRFYLLPEFAPALAAGLPPLDLLQGEFAPRLRWWRLRSFQIPAALLTLLLLLLLLAPILIERTRTAAAIRGYDQAVVELATQTLGQTVGTGPADAASAAAALAAARRAAEGGAAPAKIGLVAAMVEGVPGSSIDAVRLEPGGKLRITLGGPAAAINQLGSRLLPGPFEAEMQGIELLLGDRRAGVAATPSELSAAMLRFVSARSDAAIVGLARARPKAPDPASFVTRVGAAFAAAGLADAVVVPGGGGAAATVPAARSTALLPLLADLEKLGARPTSLAIGRNLDETLNATMVLVP